MLMRWILPLSAVCFAFSEISFLHSPALFEWTHLKIYGCSPGFGEFSNLRWQGKIFLTLHLTEEVLLDGIKRRENIGKKEKKKARFICQDFCVVTGVNTDVNPCVHLILQIWG